MEVIIVVIMKRESIVKCYGYSCYWPFWVRPQQGSSCLVSIWANGVRLSLVQKPRKVLFFGKELKGVRLCSERTVFQFSLKGREWGCVIEFSVGRGWSSRGLFVRLISATCSASAHGPCNSVSDVVLHELLPTACGASVLRSSISHEKRWTGRNTSWNQDCQEKYQ